MSTMVELPDAGALASLVSGVTETMFNITCVLDDGIDGPRLDESTWPLTFLSISGSRELTVAVATDPASSRILASTMFDCPLDEVDEEMARDALGELDNIICGQLKLLLGGECRLGLPRPGDFAALNAAEPWRAVLLRNRTMGVTVWVALAPGDI